MNKKLKMILDVVLRGIVGAILFVGIGFAVSVAIGKEDKTNE